MNVDGLQQNVRHIVRTGFQMHKIGNNMRYVQLKEIFGKY